MSRALALAQKMLFDVNRGEVMDTELPLEYKSQAFLARSLQSQAKKIKTVVAVVDARYLPRLQKYWNTSIPKKFKDFIGESVTSCEDDGETSNHMNKKRFFSNKPVVAVGVEATAVLRASSLTKLLPASTFMKVVTFKFPVLLKFFSNPSLESNGDSFRQHQSFRPKTRNFWIKYFCLKGSNFCCENSGSGPQCHSLYRED
ncbi:hypothetical protein Patl1_14664 [Pistacia atlantica]|uniref:Uncharacterized protein n=1 Tax=Pistacia atlantica TaxID=434234 RepID=A0ACC1AWM1_9ROSI|nr:hypothetical protein Patl1_14664 [Pistacia atlantica]